MDIATDWHLVLGRDGTVIGATDGAPASWVGARLDACADAPAELKEAARSLLDAPHPSGAAVAAVVPLKSREHVVHLTAIEAVPIRRGPTDIRTLLRSTLEVLRRQAKAIDIDFKIIADANVPPIVWLDAAKVAWATTMLVGNSLRYVHRGSMMMPGGIITVHVSYSTTSPSGPRLTIEVADDGTGIPAEKLATLFAPKVGQPPVGLGLPMVRDIVTAHAGRFEIQSEADTFQRGTVVRMTLPV